MNRSIPSSASVCQPKRTIALFNHELTQKGGRSIRARTASGFLVISRRPLVADFCLSQPAAMVSSLPIMVTKRAGQIECKRVVNWSAVFQLVFQLKIKLDINVINQQFTKQVQLTPAQRIAPSIAASVPPHRSKSPPDGPSEFSFNLPSPR